MTPENTDTPDNIDSAFNDKFFGYLREIKSRGTPETGRNTIRMRFDLCYTYGIGSITGRPITDHEGRPYRKIVLYKELSYPVIGRDGRPVLEEVPLDGRRRQYKRDKICWMGEDNYAGQLTETQKNLNRELGTLIDKANSFKITNIRENALIKNYLWVTCRDSYWLMFMKVVKSEPTNAPKPQSGIPFSKFGAKHGHIAILEHRGDNFGDAFDKAVYDKTEELGGQQWIEECFSQETETSKYLLTINTAYNNHYTTEMSISTGEMDISLTKEDIDQTKDLMEELIPNVFNEAKVRKNIEFVRNVLNDISKRTGLEWKEDVGDTTIQPYDDIEGDEI